MSLGAVVLIVMVVLVLVLIMTKIVNQQSSGDQLPYIKNEVLFSPAERSFLGVLDQAVGEHYRVFGKVRVADVISVKAIPNRGRWQTAFNKISAKHFDFIICNRTDVSIVCAIELDDRSHQQAKRQKRDTFLREICRTIDLPLLQIPAESTYAINDLHEKFFEVIRSSATRSQMELPVRDSGSSTKIYTDRAEPTLQKMSAVVAKDTKHVLTPTCPKCSAPMVLRAMKTGPKAGQEFWGCSTFPKCRGVTLSG